MTATTLAIPKRRRRWLQFSLQTLLLLMLVFGAGLGWFGSKVKRAREQREIGKVLNMERQGLETQIEKKHQELLCAKKAVEETGGMPSLEQRLQEMNEALAAVRNERLQDQATRRRDNEAALKVVENELARLKVLHDTLLNRLTNIDNEANAGHRYCPFCQAASLLSGDWW